MLVNPHQAHCRFVVAVTWILTAAAAACLHGDAPGMASWPAASPYPRLTTMCSPPFPLL